jgi:hypothetical protein
LATRPSWSRVSPGQQVPRPTEFVTRRRRAAHGQSRPCRPSLRI